MNDFWIDLCDKRLNVPRFVSLDIKEKIVSGTVAENKESKLKIKTKCDPKGWINKCFRKVTQSHGRHRPDNEHQKAV